MESFFRRFVRLERKVDGVHPSLDPTVLKYLGDGFEYLSCPKSLEVLTLHSSLQ